MLAHHVFSRRLKWFAIAALVGAACGVASGVFLFLLELTTTFRESHAGLLWLLPLGGFLVGSLYHVCGRSVEGGNNLILDEFHEPRATIPFRMAPLVLAGTILTHLFGGSAGREGTAVQMGGSIADQLTHFLHANASERRLLLMAGMAGGFGSVFGVPFAGTVFGIEVLAVGQLQFAALVECAISAFAAHHVTLALGLRHTVYPHPAGPTVTPSLLLFGLTAGIVFGFAAWFFARLTEAVKAAAKKIIPYLPARAAAGGAVIAIIYATVPSSQRYAGLGVPVIVASFSGPLAAFDWLGKLVLTALTLGTGFKGGEVTPLLFVGACLGNSLASVFPIPLPVLAVTGFVGVFAGAANTPIACTLMAMELFGPGIGVVAALACFGSYVASGHHGIYGSQRIAVSKFRFARTTADWLSGLAKRFKK